MIDFDLTARDQELVGLARAQGVIAQRYARAADRAHEYARDQLPEAADMPNVRDRMARHLDEVSGPAVIDVLIMVEENWGTVPFRPNSNQANFLGSRLVQVLGTPGQVARWGELSIAIALTEPDAGSDPSRIRTTATLDQATGEWVMNGEKIFISLAQSADAVLVFSRFVAGDEKGLGIFVVDKGTPGLAVGGQLDKLGQRHSDTANLVFTDCRLPAEAKLAGSMKDTLAVFNKSRPYVAAIALGFARAGLDLTRQVLEGAGLAPAYRATSIGLNAVVDRFVRLEAVYEAALLTLLHAKWVEDESGADKVEAARTKANAGRAARRILDGCLDMLGAEAGSERHLVEMWLRDARICDIYEGPGEVNRLIVARDLLGYSAAELA